MADQRVPKIHDRVSTQGHGGVYSVTLVDDAAQTVTLQTVTGNGPLIENIPWRQLQYMSEETAE